MEKRKKGYLHLNMTVQSLLCLTWKNSQFEESSDRACSSKLEIGAPGAFLPDLHHSSKPHAETLVPRPTPGLNQVQLQMLFRDLLLLQKEGESNVKSNWLLVSANGKSVPAGSLATQSLSRGFFVCTYAALRDVSSYAMA